MLWRYFRTRMLHSLALPAAFVLVLIAAGCDYVGGRTVTVDFASADGVEEGTGVYFAGVQIGETGEPDIVAGRAHVPVHVTRRHKEALPQGAVFVLEEDPLRPGVPRLSGYDLGDGVPRRTDGLYPGFTSEIEMALVVGAATARELWRQLESAR
jgi:hypothetical protein